MLRGRRGSVALLLFAITTESIPKKNREENRMKKTTKILLATLLILLGLGMLGTAGWMWFDANVDRSGWVLEEDGRYSYRDFHGKPVSGWLCR